MKVFFKPSIFLVIYLLASNWSVATNIPFGFFKLSADKISIITSAQTVLAGNCSGVTSVQYQGPSGAAKNVVSNLVVNITAVAGVTYYSDSICLTPITSVTITTGTSTSNFYFTSDTTGAKNIALAASATLIASQNETVNSNGFIWMGGGGNALWSTAANWSGGVAPGASDATLFNSSCVSNCSPTIAANISVAGVRMASGYAGTITQNTGVTLTLGSTGWFQNGGTFAGGDSAVTFNGPFTFASGTYTATSGTTTDTLNFLISGSPTFNANGGTLNFTTDNDRRITSGSIVYNNVSFLIYYAFITLADNMTINGTLTLGATNYLELNGGSLLASGNVILASKGSGYGSSLVKLVGSSNQTVTGVAGAYMMNYEVASTGGTVTYSGTVDFVRNYTYTSGTVDASASTVIFGDSNSGFPQTIDSGPVAYNNVEIRTFGATTTLNGSMTVNGTLTIANAYAGTGSINSGSILASGNVVFSNYGSVGTSLVKLVGSSNQTVTGVAAAYIPNFEVASTGGTVTYAGTLKFSYGYTITSGTLNPATSTVLFGKGAGSSGSTSTITPGSATYNNVTFQGYSSTYTLSGTLNVNGTLVLSDYAGGTVNTGTILASGDVTTNALGVNGSSLVKLVGSGNQTVTGVATANIPNFEIASTGGTVSLVGSFRFMRNFTYTSGTVSSGTSTVAFGDNNSSPTQAITPGTIAFNDVTFQGYSSTMTITGTMLVNGTLKFSDSGGGPINGGTIQAYGNIVSSFGGNAGTVAVQMLGGAAATITQTGTYIPLGFSINKTAGVVVTLATNVSLMQNTQTLNVTSGNIDMAGKNLTIKSSFALNGNTLTKNSGVLTVNSVVAGTGGLFGGTVNP